MDSSSNKHKFVGRKYELIWMDVPADELYGNCSPPWDKPRQIKVNMNLTPEHTLEILIHEAWHASDWHAPEWLITQASKDMAKFLTAQGYTKGE